MALQFHLLGTSAGGGVPQWNCGCALCTLARHEPARVAPRSQQQAALSTDGQQWFLLGASPDLRQQLMAFPPLWPPGLRGTPISGVVLLSADLDGVLGLLLLREFTPLTVYATAPVRRALESNSFFTMMTRVPGQLTWVEVVPGKAFFLGSSGVRATAWALGAQLPLYASELTVAPGEAASVGLRLEHGGRVLAYTPGLPALTPALLALYHEADAVFLDATFWSDAELAETHAGTPRARAIGHQPLGGPDGSLAELSGLRASQRVLVHINNTNPLLDRASPEHAEATAAGWQAGWDGWQLPQ